MKKSLENIQGRSKVWMIGLLLCNIMGAYGQFQTTIGFTIPTEEKSPGGIIIPNGEYLILGDNNSHPNAIGGIPDGDLQLDWIDNSGNFSSTRQSRMLGGYYFDEAAWIENAKDCNGADAYIIASSTRKVMVLTLTDPNGTPIWSREIGNIAVNSVLTSACVKMDVNGFFIIVGTATDLNTGFNSIIAVQVDCFGNQLWSKDFILNFYTATTTSVTTFASVAGGQGSYYITGKASLKSGGNEEVFMLNISTLNGGFNFLNLYNIALPTDDVGTCIQGSLAPAPNGGVWVSGYSHDINALKTVLMMRTNLLGTPTWVNTYNIQGGDEFANHFEFAANGKMVVTGKALELQPFQATKAGDCMLMRMDAFAGNALDFTRVFIGNGFSSQGNRVEEITIDEYFITGQSLELTSPSVSASDILAIRTDNQSVTDTTCYFDEVTQITPHMPIVNSISPAALTMGFPPDFNPSVLDTLDFNNQQRFCSFPPSDCDFTWTSRNCFEVDFSGTIQMNGMNPLGVYEFTWDFDCNGPDPALPPVQVTVTNPNITSLTSTISHTFPCGGGVYNVCLTIESPSGFICNVMHTITVPSTCCGQVDSTSIFCTPDSNTYAFAIAYSNPLTVGGVGSCSYSLTSTSGTISSLGYTPTPGGVMVSGLIFVSNIIPLNLNFVLQSNCICTATGLPITCSLPVSIPTICCKEIHVDDHIVCKYGSSATVPIQVSVWPPLNQVYGVNWYATPKPPSGICPPPPYPLYQSNAVANTLTPLQLFPSQLPGDLCLYAEVQLNDGPCTILTSNVAMVQLCTPDSCTLNGYDYCYFGTCIVPGPISLSLITHPDACPNAIQWFDHQNILVQTGGLIYQPTACLSMQNDQNCYEDFFFTAVITDSCGSRGCQSRIRLYSNDAPDGTLVIDPSEPQFFCPDEDATLKYTPGCAGEPQKWNWFERPCLGGTPTPIPGTGTMNPLYNTNELTQSVWYSVTSQNGVCPVDTVDLTIEVKDPLTITSFNASSDPCVEQFVTMVLDFLPCTISGCGTGCLCTYTVDWYKDGFIIATTQETPPTATFTYTTLPLYGNYYAVLKADCCPDEIEVTQVFTFERSCDPQILGPCFICDNGPVVLTADIVMFPNMPCPTFCTYEWFDPLGISLGSSQTISVTQGGLYTLVSDCNGCIKTAYFNLLPCQSIPCGPVSIQELLPKEESPVHLFPNPTKGAFTMEWKEGAPDDTRMTITDPNGIILQTHIVHFGSSKLDVSVDELPSGLYFIKVRSKDQYWTVAKLVKE